MKGFGSGCFPLVYSKSRSFFGCKDDRMARREGLLLRMFLVFFRLKTGVWMLEASSLEEMSLSRFEIFLKNPPIVHLFPFLLSTEEGSTSGCRRVGGRRLSVFGAVLLLLLHFSIGTNLRFIYLICFICEWLGTCNNFRVC